MLGDKAYDSAELREELDERGTKPVIPNRCNKETTVQLQQAYLQAALAHRERVQQIEGLQAHRNPLRQAGAKCPGEAYGANETHTRARRPKTNHPTWFPFATHTKGGARPFRAVPRRMAARVNRRVLREVARRGFRKTATVPLAKLVRTPK